jgi:hypothetical protein
MKLNAIKQNNTFSFLKYFCFTIAFSIFWDVIARLFGYLGVFVLTWRQIYAFDSSLLNYMCIVLPVPRIRRLKMNKETTFVIPSSGKVVCCQYSNVFVNDLVCIGVLQKKFSLR